MRSRFPRGRAARRGARGARTVGTPGERCANVDAMLMGTVTAPVTASGSCENNNQQPR